MKAVSPEAKNFYLIVAASMMTFLMAEIIRTAVYKPAGEVNRRLSGNRRL